MSDLPATARFAIVLCATIVLGAVFLAVLMLLAEIVGAFS